MTSFGNLRLWFSASSAFHSGITEEDLRASGVMNPSHIRRILENLPKNWNWLVEEKVVQRPSKNWKMRERKKRPVRLQGQRMDFFYLLDRCWNSRLSLSTRGGKCFAAQCAIFIPSPGAPIKEGVLSEWEVFGYWHLNTYWLNNHGHVGFVLNAFFFYENSGIQWRKAWTIHHRPFCWKLFFILLLLIWLLRL